MKVSIVVAEKHVYVDREALNITNWDGLNLPDGISAVQYDTDSKSGHIEFSRTTTPNMEIGEAQFKVFSPALSFWENEKAAAEMRAMDEKRAAEVKIAQEKVAAELAEKESRKVLNELISTQIKQQLDEREKLE